MAAAIRGGTKITPFRTQHSMSPFASELPVSLPVEDIYILMPWVSFLPFTTFLHGIDVYFIYPHQTREVGPVITTKLAQILLEIRMFVGLAKTYDGWLKQRNLVMKATLSPLAHGSAVSVGLGSSVAVSDPTCFVSD